MINLLNINFEYNYVTLYRLNTAISIVIIKKIKPLSQRINSTNSELSGKEHRTCIK